MLEKCLRNRRERYIISPERITYVRDGRYMNPYPPATDSPPRQPSVTHSPPRQPSVTDSPPRQPSVTDSPASLVGRRVIAITQYNKDGTVDRRSGVQQGRVVMNEDPNRRYKYKIMYDNPKVEPEEWDGKEDEEIKLEPLDDQVVYSVSDAKSWLASRKNRDSSRVSYMGNVERLSAWFREKDLLKILRMNTKQLEGSLRRNKKWNTISITKYLQTLLILCSDPKLAEHLEGTPVQKELEQLYRTWKNRGDAETAKRSKRTDVGLYKTLVSSYRKQSKGTMESALGALLSLGIFDEKGALMMVPRIDDVYREMRIARRAKEVQSRGNWYLVKKGRLVVRNFKTRNSKREYDYILPKEVREAVDKYIDTAKPRTYLFENSVGNTRSANDLSDRAAAIFGSNLKTQKYRMVVFNHFDKVERIDPEKLSLAMAHAVTTGRTKYADH